MTKLQSSCSCPEQSQSLLPPVNSFLRWSLHLPLSPVFRKEVFPVIWVLLSLLITLPFYSSSSSTRATWMHPQVLWTQSYGYKMTFSHSVKMHSTLREMKIYRLSLTCFQCRMTYHLLIPGNSPAVVFPPSFMFCLFQTASLNDSMLNCNFLLQASVIFTKRGSTKAFLIMDLKFYFLPVGWVFIWFGVLSPAIASVM